MHPVIDYKKCTGALACYEVCPAEVFDVEEIGSSKKGSNTFDICSRFGFLYQLFYL